MLEGVFGYQANITIALFSMIAGIMIFFIGVLVFDDPDKSGIERSRFMLRILSMFAVLFTFGALCLLGSLSAPPPR